MSDHDIIIDSLNIHLPAGWQGDPTYLARKISEQLQSQATQLSNQKQMSVSLQGHFAGNSVRAADQFSRKIVSQTAKNNGRRKGGLHD